MANRVPELIDVEIDNIILKTFVLFVQTAETVLKYSDAQFYKGANLSIVKYAALRILDINGGTMTPSQLAAWMFKERHSITTLVERLRRDGLVGTRRQTRDRRSVSVILTDKGREVLEQATPAAREIVERVMSSMSDDEAVQFGKSLSFLRQNARDTLEQLISGV